MASNMTWIFKLPKEILKRELTRANIESGQSKVEMQHNFLQYLHSLDDLEFTNHQQRIVKELRERTQWLEDSMSSSVEVTPKTPIKVNLYTNDINNLNNDNNDSNASSAFRGFVNNNTDRCNKEWKVLLELVRNVPTLKEESTENVLQFLKIVYPIGLLQLVTDRELIKCLMTKVRGRTLEILGEANLTQTPWDDVIHKIVNTLIPSRLKEELIRKHITRRFQGADENFVTYIKDVQCFNYLLDFSNDESRLIDLILQNMWGPLKMHFIFNKKPENLNQLIALADKMGDNMIAEIQREETRRTVRFHDSARREAHRPQNDRNFRGECWRCGRQGHTKNNCRVNLNYHNRTQEN